MQAAIAPEKVTADSPRFHGHEYSPVLSILANRTAGGAFD